MLYKQDVQRQKALAVTTVWSQAVKLFIQHNNLFTSVSDPYLSLFTARRIPIKSMGFFFY